jgi:hypothetical protein
MVTKTAVESVIAQSGYQIVRRFGATDLSVSNVSSDAIATLANGETKVVSGPIYVINVTLASEASCPRAPAFYDGVPLIFHLRIPGATTTRPRATTPSSVARSACISDVSSGISGTLRMVGGPPPGMNRAVPGTVTITSESGSRCDVPVVRGSFAVAVPVGSYTATGRSPDFGDGKYECSADGPVAVTNAGPATVKVVCPVR